MTSDSASAMPRATGFGAVVRAYVRLCKPRVVELLLVTTVPSMVLAEQGWPNTWLVIAVVVGGALAAGGANTINSWIERDRDQLMRRTADRPIPTGLIPATHALVFGIALNVIAFALLWSVANLLAALLTMAATLFYVFVYTIWLKPRTVQNIVIGGAAGSAPVLVGWAAVTDEVGAAAWVLFCVIFLWTPAHFWALAMKYREDYAAADFPMLPVLRSPRATAVQITAYAAATSACSLLLGLTVTVGPLYLVAAAVLAVVFVGRALLLVRNPEPAAAIRFFSFSNIYLSALFVALLADVFVR